MKRLFILLLAITFMCLAVIPIAADEAALSDDVVILYTNDVHTYIDGTLNYAVLSAIKKDLQKQYEYVILADAGDHTQGTAYGSMDKGETIVGLMNVAGYDVATLGNHEFDYGMDGCMNVIEWADFPYISSNFYHEADGVRGETVLDSYVTFDCGEIKLAFVGITTPETFTKSTPAYFQDEDGSFIYGISAGEGGVDLQNDVQLAIDQAKADGATAIIALGHLGMDAASSPFTSMETIAGVCGLDAFIDGHSHHAVEREIVKDKDGHDVLLTQTGEYLDRIGMMVIDSETGEIVSDFIECEEILAEDGETVTGYGLTSELYRGTEWIADASVQLLNDAWIAQVDGLLDVNIGFSEVVLDNYDTDGVRLVRSQETNAGDFAADALYYLFDDMGLDVDVAIVNGGGIRNKSVSGDISYKLCKEIHTFGNVACLQTVSGQQILDALEWGARLVGEGENGGFLQVSGLTYQIDTSISDTTQKDEKMLWIGAPAAEYRVHNVMIYNKEAQAWEALDVNGQYNLAGYNYTLRDLGDGFAMFDGAVNVLDYVMEDYMVLANYVQGFENGVILADNSPLSQKYQNFKLDYSSVHGSGRIVVSEKNDGGASAEETAADASADALSEAREKFATVAVVFGVLIFGAAAAVFIVIRKGDE